MADELYQILEISPKASAEEIKRAYFRLVRKHSSEQPEQFKQIHIAYNTLFDSKARENYDAIHKYGSQIQDLISKAEEKMQVKEWSNAILLLKQVLVLAPRIDAARHLLGICYINSQNWDFAVKVYRALTKTNPDVPVYWSNFGQVYKLQAESLNNGESGQSLLYHNARECFRQVLQIEQFNSAPYLDIAETYFKERNYSEALAWSESAITADGKADYNDFEALFFICRIYLFSRESQKIEVVAKRILSILPENSEIRQYVANRFVDMGFEVTKMATNLADFNMWRAAHQFLKFASNLEPNDSGIKELHEKVEAIVAAINQYEILNQDSLIVNEFKRLSAFCLANYFSFYDSEQERKSFLNDILNQISASPSNTILFSLRRIQMYYPAVYKLNTDVFNRIEQMTTIDEH